MSEEIAAADANLTEIARLQARMLDLRAALAATNIAQNRMRAALVEAQQQLGRGEIMHAQAAIRRGLMEIAGGGDDRS